MASVFRRGAVERLGSPDRLDRMLRITTPMSWLGIAAGALLAAAVIFWAFAGSLPATVSASGFLVDSCNTNTICSGAAGTVARIMTAPGDVVQRGDPVVEIESAGGKRVTVCADQPGIVSRLLAEAGAEVTPSSELIRLSPRTENALTLVCYVSPEAARQLDEGMEAVVRLGSGGYGRMTGRVTNIDRYPASAEAVAELLGRGGALAREGPVVAVACELETDPASPCGYRFLGGSAPDRPLRSGEQASAQIIVEECAPIAKVFPMLGR